MRDPFFDAQDVWRQSHGLFSRWHVGGPWVLLAEADLLVQSASGLPRDWGGAGLVQADYEPIQGLHFIFTGEALRQNAGHQLRRLVQRLLVLLHLRRGAAGHDLHRVRPRGRRPRAQLQRARATAFLDVTASHGRRGTGFRYTAARGRHGTSGTLDARPRPAPGRAGASRPDVPPVPRRVAARPRGRHRAGAVGLGLRPGPQPHRPAGVDVALVGSGGRGLQPPRARAAAAGRRRPGRHLPALASGWWPATGSSRGRTTTDGSRSSAWPTTTRSIRRPAPPRPRPPSSSPSAASSPSAIP